MQICIEAKHKERKTANVWLNGKNTPIKGKIWKSEDVTKEQNTHEKCVGQKQQIDPESLESILCSSMPHTHSLVSMLCLLHAHQCFTGEYRGITGTKSLLFEYAQILTYKFH